MEMNRAALKMMSTVAILLVAGVANAASVAPPANLTQAGKLTFCAEYGNPPLGFYDENQVLTGFEIELGGKIAERMGLEAKWKEVSFSAIIPALMAKQCDAILSQLFDKPERREVVDFVNYMYSSQSLLAPKGNPKNIKGLNDLSGLKVSVGNGTTIQGLLDAQNKVFKEAGKAEAKVVVFPKDSDARQALQTGQVDAYGTTLETAAFFFTKAGQVFDIAGEPFNKIKTGIAIRKGEADLSGAIQKAFDAMKQDGSYVKLLEKWQLGADAIE